MARRLPFTQKKIEKWIKEGRGSGTLGSYCPWLNNRSFSSIGTMHRTKGLKTKRLHSAFSDKEDNFFCICDLNDKIRDIREDYPLLPLKETVAISERLGIHHPVDPISKELWVMTTDFLLTLDDGTDIARTIKPASELEDENTRIGILEKFEIERWYWKLKDIDWGIVTELDIPDQLAKNCQKLHRFYFLNGYKVDEKDVQNVYEFMTQRILEENSPLDKIAGECDKKFGYKKNVCINVARHFIARRYWFVDLYQPFKPEETIHISGFLSDINFSKSYDPNGVDRIYG